MKKLLIVCLLGLGASVTILPACSNADGKRSEEMAERFEIEQRIKDSLKLDSFERAEAAKIALEEKQAREQAALKTQASSSTQSNQVQYASDNEYANEGYQYPVVEKKKGWSDAAKGTAIGGAVGAGLGALIDKDKRVRGAIIGAAIGGGSGYAIGRKKDRQSGRVQK